MSIINELLVKAVEDGASDVHMKEHAPPYFRLRGSLVSSGFEDLDAEAMNAVINDIMPEHAVKQYEETHEADFSLIRSARKNTLNVCYVRYILHHESVELHRLF